MKKSVFTLMLEGKVEHLKIYEDGLVFAILDNRPLTRGHALVITKEQIDHLDDCSAELYTAVFQAVHVISKQLKTKLEPKRIGLVVHGFEVPHAHVHIIPLYSGEELSLAAKNREQPSFEELSELVTLLGK